MCKRTWEEEQAAGCQKCQFKKPLDSRCVQKRRKAADSDSSTWFCREKRGQFCPGRHSKCSALKSNSNCDIKNEKEPGSKNGVCCLTWGRYECQPVCSRRGGRKQVTLALSACVLAFIFSLVALKNVWHLWQTLVWLAELDTQQIYGCLKGERLATAGESSISLSALLQMNPWNIADLTPTAAPAWCP